MSRRRLPLAVLTPLALAVTSLAHAQTAGEGESCAAYSDWASPADVRSAPGGYDVAVARLLTGHPARVTLHPVDTVAFLLEPERYPDPGVQAGLLGFTAEVAGTYRVSLSQGAWVDLVGGDELAPAIAFGHGPGCDGVAKVVEFTLAPGDYALQISGNPEPAITVMVSRVR